MLKGAKPGPSNDSDAVSLQSSSHDGTYLIMVIQTLQGWQQEPHYTMDKGLKHHSKSLGYGVHAQRLQGAGVDKMLHFPPPLTQMFADKEVPGLYDQFMEEYYGCIGKAGSEAVIQRIQMYKSFFDDAKIAVFLCSRKRRARKGLTYKWLEFVDLVKNPSYIPRELNKRHARFFPKPALFLGGSRG